jgi:hypothetical protein
MKKDTEHITLEEKAPRVMEEANTETAFPFVPVGPFLPHMLLDLLPQDWTLLLPVTAQMSPFRGPPGDP